MAFFLEDTNKIQNVSMNNLSEEIDYHCAIFNEGIAYSESSWNNITISAMQEEFKAVKEEDENSSKSSITNNIKEWFKKVIKWVQDRFNDIKKFIGNIFEKISSAFNMIKNFAVKNKVLIQAGAKEAKDQTVKIHAWKKGANGGLPGVTSFTIFTSYAMNYDEVVQKLSNYIDIDNLSNMEDVKVKSVFNTAYQNAVQSDGFVKSIKERVKRIQQSLKDVDAAAKKGMNSKDSSQVQTAKKDVETNKKNVNTYSRVLSLSVKVAKNVLSDSHKVNKACYSLGKALNK